MKVLRRIWGWLSHSHRLANAEEVRDLYKDAYFTTLMQLRAREAEVRNLRQLRQPSRPQVTGCRCCK